MDEADRHKCKNSKQPNRRCAYRRRGPQEQEIERDQVPRGRKAQEEFVVCLHFAVGEIQRAGDRYYEPRRNRPCVCHQAAGGDSIGWDEHIRRVIHHQIEHFPRPTRQEPCNVDTPSQRTVHRIDNQGETEPEKHQRPVAVRGSKQRQQRQRRAGRRENVD